MTTSTLRGKSKQEPAQEEKGLAIGETDARVFGCPRCGRPLADGASRCPGCGVRLIMGLTLRRAGGILALGVVLGVLAGGAGTTAVIAVAFQGQAGVAAVTPSAAPVASGAVPSTSVPAAPPPGVPIAAVSALSGTAVVNGRITVDAGTLAATLARKGATTIEIARALRSLAADAALGLDLTGRLAQWPDAAPVMTQLDEFYRTMAQTARVALRASLSDAAGYRRAGAEMLKVLMGLGAVNSASRTLAATVDLELPPVALPD